MSRAEQMTIGSIPCPLASSPSLVLLGCLLLHFAFCLPVGKFLAVADYAHQGIFRCNDGRNGRNMVIFGFTFVFVHVCFERYFAHHFENLKSAP